MTRSLDKLGMTSERESIGMWLNSSGKALATLLAYQPTIRYIQAIEFIAPFGGASNNGLK